jgi:hypothetical protein
VSICRPSPAFPPLRGREGKCERRHGHRKYYALDTVPEFWDWLAHKATSGQVKMPIEMLEEIKDGPKDGERDLLFAWIQGLQTEDP